MSKYDELLARVAVPQEQGRPLYEPATGNLVGYVPITLSLISK